MSFIKHGDGKIVDVLDETDLTAEQKQAVKKMSEQLVKQSDDATDSSKTKKSGS
jgi:Spy/CpxP family protein refolding chaperone